MKCYECGYTWNFPLSNYCGQCGVVANPFHNLRIRWFGFIFLLSMAPYMFTETDVALYISDLMLIAWIGFVLFRNRISLQLLFGTMPGGYNWILLIPLTILMVAFSMGSIPVTWYPIAMLDSEFVEELLSQEMSDSRFNLFILIVILAPIIEEIIFRGLIFSRLSVKWDNRWAIVGTSVIFGILHLDPVGAFVFSVVSCLLYMQTRTLIVPIVLHAMNNLIAWILSGISATETAKVDEMISLGLISLAITIPIVSVVILKLWPSVHQLIPYNVNKLEPN